MGDLKPASLNAPSPESVDATMVLETLEVSTGVGSATEDPHKPSGVERQNEGISENWIKSESAALSDSLTGVAGAERCSGAFRVPFRGVLVTGTRKSWMGAARLIGETGEEGETRDDAMGRSGVAAMTSERVLDEV